MDGEVHDADRCRVVDAASILGCGVQHVRDLIDEGDLVGGYQPKGARSVRWVSRSAAVELRASHGRPLGRSEANPAAGGRAASTRGAIESDRRDSVTPESSTEILTGVHLAADADRAGRLATLEFANLALLGANEAYAEALAKMRLAHRLSNRVNERYGEAVDALDEAAQQLREALSQFHLPTGPP